MADKILGGAERSTAAYVAWGTAKNAIEEFVQAVPNRIDRTVFPRLAGGTQSHLLASFKFLGLITGDGKPTPVLHALAVTDEPTRKKKLESVLRERYADLFALELGRTTPALLAEKMGESYNVTGSTRDKAVRFFLGAVEYLDIPVSPLLKPGNNGSRAPRKRRAAGRPKTQVVETEESSPGAAGAPPGGTARVVKLKSGGTLTVSASIDLFSLMPSDRKFVFELIDKLEEYERTNQPDAER